jgi:hypothetical protein
MTSRSGRGRWERVLNARRQAREALGREPDGGDLNVAPPKPKSKLPEPSYRTAVPLHPSERSERVLTIGEAAARLGRSVSEMEAMVKRGTVKSLMAGWTVVIPTIEVERQSRAT